MEMRNCVGAGEQRSADFSTRGIAVGMENPGAAVCRFAGKSEFRAGTIEFRAPLDELRDVLGAFFDQKRNGFGAAQSVSGGKSVLFVQTDFIFVAERHGDAALCPRSGGIAERGFGEHQNTAGTAEFDGGAQTGDARAYDGVVGLIGLWRGCHRRLSRKQVW